MKRSDGRRADEIRPVEIIRGTNRFAAGSALFKLGQTHVVCTASIEQGVPRWREASGLGWLTAEYDMLPASTGQRRARNRGRIDGRTQEIQRLIGRVLRAVVDFEAMGQNTIWIDCDVLQADGGTRTAGITGAYVALAEADRAGIKQGLWTRSIMREPVAAVSVGVVEGRIILDLCYEEDSQAEVDFNIAMTAGGRFIEIQGTAEQALFDRNQLDRILTVASRGIKKLTRLQQQANKKRQVKTH